jgi:Glycosyl transferase family 2
MGGGKKNKMVKRAEDDQYRYSKLPFVSVCTPTYNRRPFIEAAIACFNHQDYPKEKMEWIIVDDGTDKIEDLVASHPNVKYFKYDTKMPLGKKRNIMHEKSKGDILVYMDDDDYYPPERVSHAVHMLTTHPKALCAGSSEIYIYFKHINRMKQFGPYGPNHATAGTFAFKRQLLKEHRYEDHACLAEEKAFLKNYTVPFVQLDPMKVILVFSHEHNTFDKRKLLDNPNPDYVKDTLKRVNDFIKDKTLKQFYMIDLEDKLKTYEPGRPEMKPDVLEQTARMEKERQADHMRMLQEQQQQQQQQPQQDNMNPNNGDGYIILHVEGQDPIPLSREQVAELLQQQKNQIDFLSQKVKQLSGGSTPVTNDLITRHDELLMENVHLKKKVQELTETIEDMKEAKEVS